MIVVADLAARVGISTPTSTEELALARVLGAVRSKIGNTHALPSEYTDDDLDAWDEAHLLAASRLWKRKATPEGVIALGDFDPIRVGKFDPDVDDLLAPFIVFAVG